MNINDFEAPDYPGSWPEALALIFGRQRELMAKYKEIEKLPEPPVSLHHASGQRVIKDFAWRSTEELAESFEAFIKSLSTNEDAEIDGHREHQFEELADSLHFLVELIIFAGMSETQVIQFFPPARPVSLMTVPHMSRTYWEATYYLGIAMNFLRNKPWKQSHVPTDEARFREAIKVAFEMHVQVWSDVGLESEDVFNYYFRKSEVNKFRQRSNY